VGVLGGPPRGRLAGAHGEVGLTAGNQAVGQRRGFGRIEVDLAADRFGALCDRLELAGDPVGSDPRVGVGAGEQAIEPADRFEPRAADVHAGRPGDPGAAAGTGDDVQGRPGEAGVGGLDDLLGRVVAVVEQDDHLVGVAVDLDLVGERLEAAADPRLLVAGGDDDHGAHRVGGRRQRPGRGGAQLHAARSSISSRPRS
jgi:hypothetical protein